MMRRYFYCLSALFITLGTLPTFAQIGPGALLVEGNIGIRKNGLNVNGSSSGPDFVGRTSLITINPVGGIFLKDDLVIGVSGNYQYQNYRSDHTRDELATNYDFLTKGISVAPFVRRYFFLNDNLAVSGELQTGYSR